jgi:hypothetical protein
VREFTELIREQHLGVEPYFSQLLVDSSGRVWLGEFQPPSDIGPDRRRPYFIFSGWGESLGTVSLPSTFRLRDVSDDLVVGFETGTYGELAAVAYSMATNPLPGLDS